MINKKIVAKNFSKSSRNYEKYAKVQKHMAEKLEAFIIKEKNVKRILEIGAGTGYLTKLLLGKFPKAKIEVCDISIEMLKVLEKKYGNRINKYILCDVEEYKFENNYDLIISNATFQWFNSLGDTIVKLKKILNKDGQFLFSTFGKETYKELSDSFIKIGEGYSYSQEFHSKKYFEDMKLLVEEEIYMEEYKDLISFLKSIKGVGATSASEGKKVITRGVLRKVEGVYRDICGGRVEATNNLFYIRNK